MSEKRLHLLERSDRNDEAGDLPAPWPDGVRGAIAAVISAVTEEGAIWVDFEDNPGEPLRAMTVAPITVRDAGRKVLIVFERGDRRRPIVVGTLTETAIPEAREEIAVSPERQSRSEIRVDGRQVVIEAAHELLLKCGEGTILVKRDGSIVIKGTRIVSRAKGVHKIKGASVNIN